MTHVSNSCATARGIAAQALAIAARAFPDLGPTQLDTTGLSSRDARLATAIYRTAMQRWLTIEYLLNQHLRQLLREIEPTMQGVLISAGAQLLFINRLPARAVINESVELSKVLVRPGAAGMTNAVLRRLSEMVEGIAPEPWTLGNNRLPIDNATLKLRGSPLSDPEELAKHLAIATSHPQTLVTRWIETLGEQAATGVCLQGVLVPPTIVAVEPGFPGILGLTGMTAKALIDADETPTWQPHAAPEFVVWLGTHDELVTFLNEHPARRVQDPASAHPVQATASLSLSRCVDYCAGRGTKTRQLAQLHPDAKIFATDTDTQRLASLRESVVEYDNITVVEPTAITKVCPPGSVDLLLLDVPCSNTAVLGRRPEARYRFSENSLHSLTSLQRDIADQTIGLVRPEGYLLYSTCSLEPEENQDQARWIVGHYGADLINESLTLPGAEDQGESNNNNYHGGGYYALVKMETRR